MRTGFTPQTIQNIKNYQHYIEKCTTSGNAPTYETAAALLNRTTISGFLSLISRAKKSGILPQYLTTPTPVRRNADKNRGALVFAPEYAPYVHILQRLDGKAKSYAVLLTAAHMLHDIAMQGNIHFHTWRTSKNADGKQYSRHDCNIAKRKILHLKLGIVHEMGNQWCIHATPLLGALLIEQQTQEDAHG